MFRTVYADNVLIGVMDRPEDAALVCRAVNAHDALVRALTACLESIDAQEEKPDCWCTSSGNEEPPGSSDIICGACLARAALELANGAP